MCHEQDPQIRKATSVSIENNVVVLDEAHNIESVCREAGSLELSVIELGHLASSLCHLSTVEQMRWVLVMSRACVLSRGQPRNDHLDSIIA